MRPPVSTATNATIKRKPIELNNIIYSLKYKPNKIR